MNTEINENQNTCPLLGDKAPAFTAQTTQGQVHFPDDFNGHWVILFSHPTDFTPVCTTEFIYFAEMMQEFESLNTKLIGLSIDSLASHLAWLYTIEKDVVFQGMKHVKIEFPLIADLTGEVARKYCMLHPHMNETKTVRAVYFIDPHGFIRTILYYPQSLGRNFEEIKRILIGLQLNEELGISTPANWQPGDEVIFSSPQNMRDLEKNAADNEANSGVWFLSFKELSLEKIESILQAPKKHPTAKTSKTRSTTHNKQL